MVAACDRREIKDTARADVRDLNRDQVVAAIETFFQGNLHRVG